jgi:hypothetical protein
MVAESDLQKIMILFLSNEKVFKGSLMEMGGSGAKKFLLCELL